MNQKGFTNLVLVGVVVVLVALGGFFAWSKKSSNMNTTKPASTSSQADNLNWKTYTNKLHGFTFKYPSEIGLHESWEGYTQIGMISKSLSGYLTINSIFGPHWNGFSIPIKSEKINVSGVLADMIIADSTLQQLSQNTGIIITFSQPQESYAWFFEYPKNDDKISLIKQIVSTFKFTK